MLSCRSNRGIIDKAKTIRSATKRQLAAKKAFEKAVQEWNNFVQATGRDDVNEVQVRDLMQELDGDVKLGVYADHRMMGSCMYVSPRNAYHTHGQICTGQR